MLIRLLLCAMLSLCTLMSSMEMYNERVRQAKIARELAETVGRIRAMLRFEAPDVYDICQRCFECSGLIDAKDFKRIKSGDFPKLWKNACEGLDADSISKGLFSSVSDTLGSFDLDTQSERLKMTEEALIKHADELKEQTCKSKKLYTALGILSGLGISILII